MKSLFESLENRQLLSVSPVLMPFAGIQSSAALVVPLATALTNVVGSYTGSIYVSGVHTQPVKATITSQSSTGAISGTLTGANSSSLKMTLTGQVLAGNKITMTMSGGGSHPAGAIEGTGSGNIVVGATQLTMTLSFNFSQPFTAPGTLTLSMPVQAVTSITVSPAAAQTATAGQSKLFNLGSFSQSNATGPYSVDVNWGDGSADTKFSQAAAGTITAQSHAYTKATTNSVSVIITDAKGHTSNKPTFNVTVNPAAAAKLVVTKNPGTTVAGTVISPAVTVAVEDTFGNIVTTNTSTVTIAKNTSPAGSTLTGTLAVAAVKGIATFSALVLKTAGSYTLKASDGLLAAATSATFTVNPAAAAKLVVTKNPGTTVAGTVISPAVTVAVEDAFGNIVTTNTSIVTVAKNTGPNGSTLTGTLAVAAVKGIATFNTLVLKVAGSYTLKATDGLLAGATSASFIVNPAAAAKLVFVVQPASAKVGKAIVPAVKVAVEDAFGNIVIANKSTVTMSISTGPTGGVLGGVVGVADVSGVSTFSNLLLSKAGSYKLKAVDGVLTSTTSNSFVVV